MITEIFKHVAFFHEMPEKLINQVSSRKNPAK